MKKHYILAALFAASHGFCQDLAQHELIVKFRPEVPLAKIDAAHHKIGFPSINRLDTRYGLSAMAAIGKPEVTRTFVLTFALDIDVKSVTDQYMRTGLIAFAEPDYIAYGGGMKINAEVTPSDSAYWKQWGLHNDGTLSGIGPVVAGADVKMEDAWNIETGDPDMIIAVPDTGLRMVHPEIASRLWSNPNETLNGLDDDGNGMIDDINGWDFVNNDNAPVDDYGHGTNVIGIIGAVANNGTLFTGVNWNSRIMPLKVLNSSNSGTYAAMAASIYYAVDNGAKVISMSIGGSGASALISDALSYANDNNVLFVACMMNFNNNTPYYPAAYSLQFPNVIAVGSTNPDDSRTAPFFWSATSGSNYGSHLCVVAPGNYIYGLDYQSNTNSNSYWGGTSQATPLVAGIASLILAHNPALTPQQVRQILEDTAEDQVGDASEDTPGFDVYMGYGRVNALAALQSPLAVPKYNPPSGLIVVNPITNNEMQVFNSMGAGDFVYRVNDMAGREVASGKMHLSDGNNRVPLSVSSGNYLLTIERNGYRKIFKLVKGE